MDAVRSAVSGGDADAVRRAAHALKGAAGNFNAAGTVAVASELERIGRSGDLLHAAAVFTRLEAEASRLVTALRAFGGPGTCAS